MLSGHLAKAKYSLRWVCVALFISAGHTATCAEEEQQQALSKTSLWEVRSTNTTAYLLGSIHLLSESAYPLPSQMDSAFKSSEQLVLEVDLVTMKSPDAQIDLLVKGMLPRGESLTEILSPKTLKLANAITAEIGLTMVAFKHYKPWMFVMTLTAAKLQQLGLSSQYGVDWHYFERAMDRKMPIIGLETIDEQIGYFEKMEGDDRDEFVRQSLEDFDLIESELGEIMAAWRSGNMDVMERTLLKNLEKYPRIQSLLINERNRNWIEKLDTIMQSGVTTMVIVGAGHIPGKDGLLQLLQSQGYTVQQQ